MGPSVSEVLVNAYVPRGVGVPVSLVGHPTLLRRLSQGGTGVSEGRAAGQTVYRCDLCGVSMSHAYSMQRHRKQHLTQPKSFVCQVCGRRYNRRDNLLVHVRTHLTWHALTFHRACNALPTRVALCFTTSLSHRVTTLLVCWCTPLGPHCRGLRRQWLDLMFTVVCCWKASCAFTHCWDFSVARAAVLRGFLHFQTNDWV